MSNIIKPSECSYPECGPTCRKDCPPLPTKPEPIEPTEAQRRAATGIVLACLSGANVAASVFVVARLLAEREAKLREEVLASYKGTIGHIRYMHDSDVMKLRARVAELEEEVEALFAVTEEDQMREAQHLARIAELEQQLSAFEGGLLLPFSELAKLYDYDDAKDDAPAVDMQAWANGSCPEPGCSLANPHQQGAACVKPTAEGGEG